MKESNLKEEPEESVCVCVSVSMSLCLSLCLINVYVAWVGSWLSHLLPIDFELIKSLSLSLHIFEMA